MLCNTVKRLVVYNLYNFEKLGSVSRDLKDRETESLQESKPNFPPRTLRTQPKNLLLLLTMSSTRNLALHFLFDHNFMTKILNFWNSVTQHQFPSPPTSIFYHSHHLCA